MSSSVTTNTALSSVELPILHFNFGSITGGTDIPPPQRSTESNLPTPPETPPSRHEDSKSKALSGLRDVPLIHGNRERRFPQSAIETTPSPPETGRPGGVICPLNKTSMNTNEIDNQLPASRNVSMSNASRPASQSDASIGEEQKSKRSSAWFRRFRSAESGSKRRSAFFGSEESVAAQPKPAQAPPPMIPELPDLANGHGNLGDDLFNHIK